MDMEFYGNYWTFILYTYIGIYGHVYTHISY